MRLRTISFLMALLSSAICSFNILAEEPGDTTSITPYGWDTPTVYPWIDWGIIGLEPLIPDWREPGQAEKPEEEKVPTVDPANPGIPEVDNDYAVGATAGSLSVSNTGAAVYNIDIACPYGGYLTPLVQLSYNSQDASYGLAGYGITISGFSSITRGMKTPFNNDGVAAGVTMTATDNLFLDGRLMVLVSGNPYEDGATYCLEGDPHTTITAHIEHPYLSEYLWFEVMTKDGVIHQYGNSDDSRIEVDPTKGIHRIYTWMVNQSEDLHGDKIEYQYTVSNLYAYPKYVKYGLNSRKSRGIVNLISFEYEDMKASHGYFNIGGRRGKIDRRLSSITTSTDGTTFRKYHLSYTSASDPGLTKYARLASILEENGDGDSLTPTRFEWACNSPFNIFSSTLDDPSIYDHPFYEEQDRRMMAADMNGDGVSDIIRLSTVRVYNGPQGSGGTSYVLQTHLYISLSEVSPTGAVTYRSPSPIEFPAALSWEDCTACLGGASLLDYDGDGYNDLLLPFFTSGKDLSLEKIFAVNGREVSNGGGRSVMSTCLQLGGSIDAPLTVTLDADNDGRDDAACLYKTGNANSYQFCILRHKGKTAWHEDRFDITLPSKPEKLFAGDYDNDGLTDLLVICKDDCRIYLNPGGSSEVPPFSGGARGYAVNLKDCWRIAQGDIDGDGLLDFVYNISGESFLRTAINNGDCTFTLGTSEEIGLSDNRDKDDDSLFDMHVFDIDGDGRSDVFLCKAQSSKTGSYKYGSTEVRWLLSDGENLKVVESVKKHREKDADENNIFIGDFNGDGMMELANLGTDLTSINDDFTQGVLHTYHATGGLAKSRKITTITDGMGEKSTIEYAHATNPVVYTRGLLTEYSYPVNAYTFALPVVKSVRYPNGSAGAKYKTYSYRDMLVHIGGKGPLGFSETAVTDMLSGEVTRTAVTGWDTERWIPTETTMTDSIAGRKSTAISHTAIKDVGNTYFAYGDSSEITDMYGNKATTTTTYDVEKGVLTGQRVKNAESNMYKAVTYSGYVQKSGIWLPTTMTMTQKHEDDPQPAFNRTTYSYNAYGDMMSLISNAGSDLELRTLYQYDVYGNRTSSCSYGIGIKPVTSYTRYDSSGRFAIENFTNPASSVVKYSHDRWGNVTEMRDETNSSDVLVTANRYDGWGRLVSTTATDGTRTTYERGWGTGNEKKHYVLVRSTGVPWVITWFDGAGNETYSRTFGPRNVLVSTDITRNANGQVCKVGRINGLLSDTEETEYDEFGRVASVSSNGRLTEYSYGNRRVSAMSDGKTTVRTMDAWGNPRMSTGPSGDVVNTTYGSNGKPTKVTASGSVTTMAYDLAGNLVERKDSDRGVTTCTYTADGKLMESTDAKGVKTINTYDNLGRVQEISIGEEVIHYTYGTAGNERMRLVDVRMDGNSITLRHDRYGRVVEETRSLGKVGSFLTKYDYGPYGRLAGITLPGGMEVRNGYSAYGFKTSVTANGTKICELKGYDGRSRKTALLDSLTLTETKDKYGRIRYKTLSGLRNVQASGASKAARLDSLHFEFDTKTGNLLTLSGMNRHPIKYAYDALDRLTSATRNREEILSMSYATNGNITSKSGVGNYTYDSGGKPHAVMSVDNSDDGIPSLTLNTLFNSFGKISGIEETGGCRMDFTYGPDLQRWRTEISKDGAASVTSVYMGNYEKITQGGKTHEYWYLDGNTILVRENGTVTPYAAFTDHLGSILGVYGKNSEKVFDAEYDAWGRQEVRLNKIRLRRGYTSHEMLPEFGLVNMNGRLYDPALGQFLSPDPYVQFPGLAQSWNPYSYCLNNPMKYTDPSGEFISPLLGFALFNAATSMMRAAFNGDNIWKAAGLSILSSAASYGVGQIFGNVGNVGKELLRAGAHGVAGSVVGMLDGKNFGSSFASSAISSGMGSYALGMKINSGLMILSSSAIGGVAAWASGGDFVSGALQGMRIGLFNHTAHFEGHSTTTKDENGEFHTDLPNFVIIEKANTKNFVFADALTTAAFTSTYLNCYGQGLETYGGISTIGSKKITYFNFENPLPLSGSESLHFRQIGKTLAKNTNFAGYALGSIQVVCAINTDYQTYKETGHTDMYNTVKESASFGGSLAGAYVGVEIGAAIGSWFGVIGAIPGAVIGGAVFGLGMSAIASHLSGIMIDVAYGKW